MLRPKPLLFPHFLHSMLLLQMPLDPLQITSLSLGPSILHLRLLLLLIIFFLLLLLKNMRPIDDYSFCWRFWRLLVLLLLLPIRNLLHLFHLLRQRLPYLLLFLFFQFLFGSYLLKHLLILFIHDWDDICRLIQRQIILRRLRI